MTGAEQVRSDPGDDVWMWAGAPDSMAPAPSGLGMRRPKELSLRLRPVPFATTKARKAVRAYCLAHALERIADDAELLTAELVTNAVVHARYLVTVHAAVQEGQLSVTVTDDAEGPIDPAPSRLTSAGAGGRGLFIVAALAADWGLDLADCPSTAWFRLP
jgi:hypothetical protein